LYPPVAGVIISTAFEQLIFESGRFGRFFCSMGNLPDRVEKEIEKIVTSEGLELVHIDYKKQGRGYLLRSLYVESLKGTYGLGRSAKSKAMPILLLVVMTLPREQFTALIQKDSDKWEKVVKSANIKMD